MMVRPYSIYKDSGVEWMPKVPDDWNVKPLFALASERKESNKGMIENNLLSLSYGRIVNKDINSNEGLLPESFETYQIVHTNDMVFRLTDLQNDKRSLRSAIVKEKGIITSAYTAVTPTNIQPEYLSSLLRAYDLQKVFYSMGDGLRQSMKYSDIKRLPLPLPPYDVQIQITKFLDRETGKLDTLISKQEQLIDRFNERIIATAMGAILSTETQYIRLSHVCEVISRPVNQASENAFTRLGVLNRGRGLFKREETDSEDMGDSDFFWVKNGDLILSGQFAWEGSVAMADDDHDGCVVSHRFPIIKGKTGVVLTEYLLALFMTSHGDFLLNENSRGSAGRNRPLNMSLLLKEKIPIASIAIQNEVANLLRLQKKLKDKALVQIDLLKEHRTALISAVVTGKIDVREAA